MKCVGMRMQNLALFGRIPIYLACIKPGSHGCGGLAPLHFGGQEADGWSGCNIADLIGISPQRQTEMSEWGERDAKILFGFPPCPPPLRNRTAPTYLFN